MTRKTVFFWGVVLVRGKTSREIFLTPTPLSPPPPAILNRLNNNININLAVITNKDNTKVCNNIKLRLIGSCRFMASSIDKLTSNLCDTSGIRWDKCISNMELVNVSRKYITLLEWEICKLKNIKNLDE